VNKGVCYISELKLQLPTCVTVDNLYQDMCIVLVYEFMNDWFIFVTC
jgi:hypothetical protein